MFFRGMQENPVFLQHVIHSFLDEIQIFSLSIDMRKYETLKKKGKSMETNLECPQCWNQKIKNLK